MNCKQTQSRTILKQCVSIFFATIIIVFIFWLIVPGGWSERDASDYQAFYKPVALNLLAGKGLVTNDGSPYLRTPPGFPFILAGLFGMARWTGTSEQWWLQGFTMFAMGLTCVLLYGLALMAVGEKAALITAILWMTYPFNLWLTKQPNSEIAFFPIFYGALFLLGGILWRGLAKPWVALIAGILIGCAYLVRPIVILVGILLAGLLIVLRRKVGWKRYAMLAMLLLIGNVIPVIPWEIWVRNQTKASYSLSAVRGLGVGSGIASGIACLSGTNYRQPLKMPSTMRKVVMKVVEQRERLKDIKDIVAFLREQIKENPIGVLQLFWFKMKRAWYGTDSQKPIEKWILLLQIPYLLLIFIGSCLLWWKGSTYRELFILTLLLTFYFWTVTTVFFSILRYMVPAIGLLFPSIATLLDFTLSKFSQLKTQHST